MDVLNGTATDGEDNDLDSSSAADCDPTTLLDAEPTKLGDIPAKEIIIVVLMLALWIYSIVLTRKAWYRILKE